jgi:hypothetical protein
MTRTAKPQAASPFSCPASASSFRGCSSVGLLPRGAPLGMGNCHPNYYHSNYTHYMGFIWDRWVGERSSSFFWGADGRGGYQGDELFASKRQGCCVYRKPRPDLFVTAPCSNGSLPAFQVREKAIQRIEILRLSAGISRDFPCNLAESPCISLICKERRVGL